MAAALSAVALTAVLVLTVGVGGAGYQAALDLDLDLGQASATRRGLAVGANSGFDASIDVSTTGNALAYLPKGLVIFGLGPFPWQLSGARQIPAVFDVLALWAMLPSLKRGFRQGRVLLGRGVYLLVLPAAITSLPLALAVGNFGFLARERMQVLILLLPLISLGLAQRAAANVEEDEQETAGTDVAGAMVSAGSASPNIAVP